MKLPISSNLTENRSKRWLNKMEQNDFPTSVGFECDTVGCVIIDSKGKLASGSSTGGVGNEFFHRVSDSGTVAGNFASRYAGINVTGKGEQINNDAVASKTETRIRDGMSLSDAFTKTFKEAKSRKHSYGLIGLDAKANYGIAHTTNAMPYVIYGASGLIAKFEN